MNPDIAIVEGILSGALALPTAYNSSPIACALGMSIVALSGEDGTAVLEFEPKELFLQGAGVLQGGAVAAMLDYAMIIGVMATMPRGSAPATTNLDLVCLRPAPLVRFRAEAFIRRRTRSVVFTQASLRLLDGTEVAAASATNFIGTPGQ